MGAYPHIWVPNRSIIPPSPPRQRRIEREKQIKREMHTYTGRVLQPGSPAYNREVSCLGAGIFFPGLAAFRRETTHSAAATVTLTNDLLLSYSLNSTDNFASTGKTDNSVNGRTLTKLGTVTSVAGKFSNAASMDNSGAQSNYLACSNTANFYDPAADISLSVWVWMDTGNNAIGIAGHNGTPPAQPPWAICADMDGVTHAATLRWFYCNTANSTQSVSWSSTTSKSAWHNVIGMFDANDGSGNRVGTIIVDNGTPVVTTTAGTATILTDGRAFQIGQMSPTPYNYFKGVIDEVNAWTRLLTATEITDLQTKAWPFT